MKRTLIYSIVFVMTALAIHAQVAKSSGMIPASLTNAQFLAKSGGLVQAPSQGPVFKFINAQSRVTYETVAEMAGGIQKLVRLSVKTEQTTVKDEASVVAETALKSSAVAAVVVLSDKAGQPTLLVAPDSRWAVVNIGALATPGVTAELLELRVKKEMLRGFAYLMGAANSGFEACVMKPVFKPEDLDAIKGQSLAPDTLMKTSSQAAKMGIKPARMTTYRKACEEGWAPMPTNSLQKAVWEEVKAKK